jgi:hypothetical protein
MTLIEETKKMYSQLVKEYVELSENNGDFFELKNLELEILRCEAQLRILEVDI